MFFTTHLEELDTFCPFQTTYDIQDEIITPHKMSIILLLQHFFKGKKEQFLTETETVDSANSRRNFCLLILKLFQLPEMSFYELNNILNSPCHKINQQYFESYRKTIGDIVNKGIEALFDFTEMQSAESMIAEEYGINQFSIAGYYIRKFDITLNKITFSEMIALYQAICTNYETAQPSFSDIKASSFLEKSDFSVGQSSIFETADESLEKLMDRLKDDCHRWNSQQTDSFIEHQSDLLENDEYRAMSPIRLQMTLNCIMRSNPSNCQTYFLYYMNQVRIHNYHGAIETLHRAFDCGPVLMSQQNLRGFQMFSINLAILHINFNHSKEALKALNECVMLAQEAGDERCLILANIWHCILNRDTIDRLVKNLADIDDPEQECFVSLSLILIAKFAADIGFEPQDVFKLLMRHDEYVKKSTTCDISAEPFTLRTALWNLYGDREISSLYSHMFLHVGHTFFPRIISYSEGLAKMLASVSLWLSCQGYWKLSNVILQNALQRIPRFPHGKPLMIAKYTSAIDKAFFDNNATNKALANCALIYNLDIPNGYLQRGGLCINKRHFYAGNRILNKLLHSKTELNHNVKANALITLSKIKLDMGSPVAEPIILLINCSTYTTKYHMEYEMSLANVQLSRALLKLDMPVKAYQIICNSVDMIYTNGTLYDRAELDVLISRCSIAISKNENDKRKRLKRCTSSLERAMNIYKSVYAHAKVLEILAFLSIQYNEVEDMEKRNHYARQFRVYFTSFPCPHEHLAHCL